MVSGKTGSLCAGVLEWGRRHSPSLTKATVSGQVAQLHWIRQAYRLPIVLKTMACCNCEPGLLCGAESLVLVRLLETLKSTCTKIRCARTHVTGTEEHLAQKGKKNTPKL
jgi:hypothetical protein